MTTHILWFINSRANGSGVVLRSQTRSLELSCIVRLSVQVEESEAIAHR